MPYAVDTSHRADHAWDDFGRLVRLIAQLKPGDKAARKEAMQLAHLLALRYRALEEALPGPNYRLRKKGRFGPAPTPKRVSLPPREPRATLEAFSRGEAAPTEVTKALALAKPPAPRAYGRALAIPAATKAREMQAAFAKLGLAEPPAEETPRRGYNVPVKAEPDYSMDEAHAAIAESMAKREAARRAFEAPVEAKTPEPETGLKRVWKKLVPKEPVVPAGRPGMASAPAPAPPKTTLQRESLADFLARGGGVKKIETGESAPVPDVTKWGRQP